MKNKLHLVGLGLFLVVAIFSAGMAMSENLRFLGMFGLYIAGIGTGIFLMTMLRERRPRA